MNLRAVFVAWLVVLSVVASAAPVAAADAPAIVVSGAVLSSTTVTAGDAVQVMATVTNTGTNGTTSLTLSADGTPLATRSVSVPANATETVVFDASIDAAGTYELAVDGVVAGTLTVEPAPSPDVSVVSAALTTNETVTGATVAVDVTAEITGDAAGSVALTLTANGTAVATTDLTVPAGAVATGPLSTTFDAPGAYALAVNGIPAGTVTVEPAPAPELSVTNVSAPDAPVYENRPTTVSVTVENTGDASGTMVLELTANGSVVATGTATVSPGDSTTTALVATFDDPGTVELAVNEVPAGTLTVLDDPFLVEECRTITAPGTYRVGADLTAPATAEACIVVAADDVVIDGDGHTLDGTVGFDTEAKTVHFGVRVAGSDDDPLENVSVRDLTVTEWTHGVDYDGVAGGTVENVTAVDNRVGIAFRWTSSTTVTDGRFADSATHGIRIRGHSDGVAIDGATVVDSGKRGIFVNRADATDITDTRVSGGEAGIYVQDAVGTVVRDSTVAGASEAGIAVIVTNGTRILGTDVTGGDVGILVRASHGTGMESGADHETGDDHETDSGSSHETDANETTDHGVVVTGPAHVVDTTVTGSTVGIAFVGTDADVVEDTTVEGAVNWSLRLAGASDVQVTDLAVSDLATVSFVGTDVALRPTAVPAVPAGHGAIDVAVEAAATSANASWTDLALRYDQSVVGADESTLHLWRHDGSAWSLVGTPAGWHYDADVGWTPTAVEGAGVTPDATTVRADAPGFGVVAPLTGLPTTTAIGLNATLDPVAVDDGDAVTVIATVTYDGTDDATVRLDLTADGAVVETRTVAVTAGDPARVTFEPRFGPGSHALAIGDLALGTVTVRDVTAPVAASGSDRGAYVGRDVAFDGSASTDDVGVATYEWNFGDGTTASGASVTHAYAHSGTYTATLRVTDAAGNGDTSSVVVTVRTPHHHSSRTVTSSGPAVSYPTADEAVVTVRPDEPESSVVVPLAFPDDGTCHAVDELRYVAASTDEVQLSIERTTALPDGVAPWSSDADRPVFGYLLVDAPDGTASTATLSISVATACLDARNRSPADVLLYRYEDGGWVALPTEAVAVDADVATFSADSTHLSTFAIGTAYPDLSVRTASIADPTVTAGDRAVVRVDLDNGGTGDGDRLLELSVDDVVVATRLVTVPADGSVHVTLAHRFVDPGTYTLALDGETLGTVVVEPAEPPASVSDPARVTADPATPAADMPGSDDGVLTVAFLLVVLALGAGVALLGRR